jgi:tRNA-splicing ligase RtcB
LSDEAAYGRSSERVPLKQLSEYVWEIPQSFRPGMRVAGRIYADKSLLEKMRSDATLEQCANVATLPGIHRWSITMPDGHEGYGFPIGGVAAMDYDEGVVSPGGVGYDINCLSGESLVLTEFGFTLPIRHFETAWSKQRVRCLSSRKTVRPTEIVRFLKLPSDKKVYRVRSELGHTVIATEDHPFLTPRGMVPLGKLRGEPVAVFPFRGIPYEEPGNLAIVSEHDIEELCIPCAKKLLTAELNKRGLLPLSSNSAKLPYLLKIMGFVLGDGVVVLTKSTHIVGFFGMKEDLEDIREDIARLGFKPSRIYSRQRKSSIVTKYGVKEFETVEYSFKVVGRSFAALLMAMGVPSGSKSKQSFTLPPWLFRLPLWQKRLFLAAFFGAELSSPKTMTGHERTFYAPMISQNKSPKHLKSGLSFMRQLKRLLHEFGVQTYSTSVEKEATLVKNGSPSTRIRLHIVGAPDNLARLWSTIGFEYNREKTHLANVAVTYLKRKLAIVERRQTIAQLAVGLHGEGIGATDIYERLVSDEANRRFIERSLYLDRAGSPRIPQDFPSFDTYLKVSTKGLGRSGAVWDRIVRKEEVPFNEYVYDFTVRDAHHDFMANGFVVSNCGVRLIRTNLNESDVRPALPRLLDVLFNNIPSGLGSLGKIRVTQTDLDKVVADGVEWAIDHGYGWSEDKTRCEESGCMESADPSKVSSTAKSRGHRQLGSLGSGNHFLEIEKVDKIFDERVGRHLGIERVGQIFVLVHTGSRGYGHQVCSDYLRVMERAVSKYHISLPDRQLACAPTKSPEAEDYLPAMASACNFAWVNRQMITHWTREAFEKAFGKTADQLDMHLIYDVCHNVAKIENHVVDQEGHQQKVVVHRKGATRAFPPGHPDIPPEYREIGQPVLIPGSMGTSSWLLVGTPKSMELSFGSTAHGAGRMMSRAAAKRRWGPQEVKKGLAEKGIMIRAAEMGTVTEEAPGAYKDVDRVAEVSHQVGIATKVCRLVPIGVTKG